MAGRRRCWRATREPALYVYEQVGPGYEQRGLLAAVALHDPADRVVLPHEDVMPGPVADRLELMRATGANLEPILLVYDGGGETAAVLDEVAPTTPLLRDPHRGRRPAAGLGRHRPRRAARVAADLAPRQALIADGHHRWATYRRLQAEQRAGGDGPGPWDSGLAMLVDSRTSPLQVAAIHRVVAGARSRRRARPRRRRRSRCRRAGDDLDERAGGAAGRRRRGTRSWSRTARQFRLSADPDPVTLADALPADRPEQVADAGRERPARRAAGTAVVVVPADDPRVGYLHDAAGAPCGRRAAAHGVAVLLRPVDVADVLALAAEGERMPRKSTSFGPKPRTGLVLRLLDE